MAGSMRERGKGIWELTIDMGRDTENKRKRSYHTFKGTQRAAEKELARLTTECENGTYVKPSKMTFGEYLEYWLNEYARRKLTDKTYSAYTSIIRLHITPSLGSIKLHKLKLFHIQQYCDNLIDNGRKDGRTGGLSPASVVKHFRVIHRALHYAVTKEMLIRNVADGVELPSQKKPKYTVLTIEQINQMLEPHPNERQDLCRMVDLAIHTGLRRGEVLGLRFGDIDFTNRKISIKQTVQYTKEKGVFFKGTKTEASEADIFISDHELELLKAQQIEQKKRKLAATWWEDHDLVFTQDNGKPIHPDTISSWFPEYLERLKLPRIRFHDLRHIHATYLLESGETLATVSKRLRHAEKTTTANIYSHTLESSERKAAETMTRLRKNTQ